MPLFQSEAKCEAIHIYSPVKKDSFSQERFFALPLFESESFWNSEMTYLIASAYRLNLAQFRDSIPSRLDHKNERKFRRNGCKSRYF